jgi:hypothetical protein
MARNTHKRVVHYSKATPQRLAGGEIDEGRHSDSSDIRRRQSAPAARNVSVVERVFDR